MERARTKEHEVYGRKQQVYIEMLGAVIGIIVVMFLRI